MEVKTREGEKKNESAQRKTRVLIRTAKAVILLSSLHNRLTHSTIQLNLLEEEKELRRENEDLRMKLLLERAKNRNINLCAFSEFLLLIVVWVSFWLSCFLVVFIF